MCDSREEPYLPPEGCWDLTSPPPCNFCIVSRKNPGHIEPHPHPHPPQPFHEGIWLFYCTRQWPQLISKIEIENWKNNYVLHIGQKAIS